jgi:hypothetical protein
MLDDDIEIFPDTNEFFPRAANLASRRNPILDRYLLNISIHNRVYFTGATNTPILRR